MTCSATCAAAAALTRLRRVPRPSSSSTPHVHVRGCHDACPPACAWTVIMVVLAIAAPAAQPDIPRLLDRADTLLRASDLAQGTAAVRACARGRTRKRPARPTSRVPCWASAEIAQREGAAPRTAVAHVVEALAIVERLEDAADCGCRTFALR